MPTLTHSQITLPPDHAAVMNYEAAKRRLKKWEGIHASAERGLKRWSKRQLKDAQQAEAAAAQAILTEQAALTPP